MAKTMDAREYTRMLRRMTRAGYKYYCDADCADLRDLCDLQREIRKLIVGAVRGMRESGHTWREIADCASVSHVTAINRWGAEP